MNPVDGISVDFFNTLVFHREGRGRGRALIEYLEVHGFAHAPWEHQVLYDVFEEHDELYAPKGSPEERHVYHAFLAGRVFERLAVRASDEDALRHAGALWEILGPNCLGVFPDVWETLEALRAQGYPIAVVSNWQRGLRHFCVELGLSKYLDHVVGSADFGAPKPDPSIFREACDRLGLPPGRVVHVGDSPDEDYRAGEAAGLEVILLQRDAGSRAEVARVIRGLDELPALLERT